MTDFIPAGGFTKLVASARRIPLPDALWSPVFNTYEEALAFARYVGGFPRRIAPGTVTRPRPTWSEKQRGYVARLSVLFPGWGPADEEGTIACWGNKVAGLALEQDGRLVLLPLKAYTHTLRTQSDTLYVLYADGTGFCRSKRDGAIAAAAGVRFAVYAEAMHVYQNGGVVRVSRIPAVGLVPLYLSEPVTTPGENLDLRAKSFRRGTPIASVFAA